MSLKLGRRLRLLRSKRARAVQEENAKKVKDLVFNIQRSIRYHSRRQAFFETFDTSVNTANLILGSGAIVALIKETPGWLSISLTAVVAIISFLNLAMRSAQRSSLHSQLQQRFIDLLKRVKRLDPTQGDCGPNFKKCEEKMLDIERDEPPIYRIVDLLAHNEQCRAQGASETHIYHVPKFMVLTANLWRYETENLPTLSEAKKRAKAQQRAKNILRARRAKRRFWWS